MDSMATAMMIDTLQVSRRLRDAGADERVADAVAAVFAEAALGSREDLATKGDLGLLRADFALLRSEVNVFRTEMENAILASQNRMLLAIGAMLATTVGVLFTLLRH